MRFGAAGRVARDEVPGFSNEPCWATFAHSLVEGTMTLFSTVRRTAALSAIVAMFSSSIADAQTPAPATAGDAPATSIVLSSTAFARLARVARPAAVSGPDVGDANAPPRLNALAKNPMVTARLAEVAVVPAPKRSRSVGQKVVVVLGLVGIFAGALVVSYYTGVDSDQILDGIFQRAAK
jgi:hypothetical protein